LIDLYITNRSDLEESLYRELVNVDLKALELIRKKTPDKDGVMGLIDEILSFARRRFGKEYRTGLETRSHLIKQIQLTPVGIVNPNFSGGLLFFRNPGILRVYSYRTRLVRRPESTQSHKDVYTNFIDELKTGLLPDFSAIKWKYIKNNSGERELSTYLVESEMEIPRFESLIPLVKERLLEIEKASGR
jgi:hypothetical protein